MAATLERTLSRTSSMSIPVSSPRLSVRREITPPATSSDQALFHVHDRINLLDSRVQDLRSTALTKDAYVERRNREDEHIRREFDAQRVVSARIDANVVAIRADVDQVKTGIFQLKSSISLSGTETTFLRSDVDRLQKHLDEAQANVDQLQTAVCGCRVEISKLQASISQLRTDLLALQHGNSRRFDKLEDCFDHLEGRFTHLERRFDHLEGRFDNLGGRFDNLEGRFDRLEAQMVHDRKVRFNSLAYTAGAPITSVPMIGGDGSVRWPEYFPRTVWRFWCLKKRNRVNRLVELAEFYQLEGYQYWSRTHQSDGMFSDSDSSESSDTLSGLTRAEAVTLYPEAAHQALAATLGLVYYKIRNEVGEGAHAHIPRPPKRTQEEISTASSKQQKPVKIARRPNNTISPTTLHRLITGVAPSVESRSLASDESDKLGWNVHSDPPASAEDTASKLRALVSEDVGALLRALEQGRIRLKPSRSERLNMSPTDNKARSLVDGPTEDDNRTVADTIATELISPLSGVGLPPATADPASPKEE